MLRGLRPLQTQVWKGTARRIRPYRSRTDDQGTVALTFDDGPNPTYTPQVLDVLKSCDVRATFFLVGARAAEHPTVVQAILDDGHAIGSHTVSHPDMWTLRWKETFRQYREGARLVEQVAGRPVPLFRPPKGWYDVRGATAARRMGFDVVLWSATGDDWVPGSDESSILNTIGDVTGGEVILLHDGLECPLDPAALDRSATVAIIEPLVDAIREAGLSLVTL